MDTEGKQHKRTRGTMGSYKLKKPRANGFLTELRRSLHTPRFQNQGTNHCFCLITQLVVASHSSSSKLTYLLFHGCAFSFFQGLGARQLLKFNGEKSFVIVANFKGVPEFGIINYNKRQLRRWWKTRQHIHFISGLRSQRLLHVCVFNVIVSSRPTRATQRDPACKNWQGWRDGSRVKSPFALSEDMS